MFLPLVYPIAIAQGLLVLARTPRLPRARGGTGVHGPGTGSLRLVGLGDSIIAGVGCSVQDEALLGQFAARLHERTGREVRWLALGRSGATARTVEIEFAPSAPEADLYLLSVGVNDTVRGVSAADFATRLLATVEILQARAPDAGIVFAGAPPLQSFPAVPWPLSTVLGRRAADLQRAARSIAAQRPAMHCFDLPQDPPPEMFAGDGFHPGPDGCRLWAQWLCESYLSRPAAPLRWRGAAAYDPV